MKIVLKPQGKILPLDECLDSILRGVTPKYVEFSSIAALNQRAIRWGYIDTDALKYHDSNKELKEEAFIRKGDITLNSTGDITIGRAYFFKREWPNLFADSHITILRLKQDVLLPDFLIYLLPTPEYQNKIYNLVTGATGQLELNRTNLRKLEVVVPSMPTQRKIASILSAYDNLIDTNRRRIQLLEESARLLFREWFVYFRFPGHEKVKIVDGVPEGWERLQVKDIIRTVNARKKLQKSEYDEAGLYPCVDQSQEFISGYSDRKDYVINNIIPIVIFGDHTRIIKYVAFPFVSGADGTQLLVSKHNKINSEFLYFILKNINLSNYFYARHFKFLKDQWILVPTEYLCSSFILFSKNIMKQISVLRSQTQKLA